MDQKNEIKILEGSYILQFIPGTIKTKPIYFVLILLLEILTHKS